MTSHESCKLTVADEVDPWHPPLDGLGEILSEGDMVGHGSICICLGLAVRVKRVSWSRGPCRGRLRTGKRAVRGLHTYQVPSERNVEVDQAKVLISQTVVSLPSFFI